MSEVCTSGYSCPGFCCVGLVGVFSDFEGAVCGLLFVSVGVDCGCSIFIASDGRGVGVGL